MSECILWLGSVSNRGYGLTYRDGKRVSAHREAFRLNNPGMRRRIKLDAAVIERAQVMLATQSRRRVAALLGVNESSLRKHPALAGR